MKTDHVKMLCDIGELNSLFEESSLEDLLQKTVEMVAGHMLADVCSIYIYDEANNQLILKATHGLKPDSVNMVRLRPGEGIIGSAIQEMRPICEKCGEDNPNYKFYPGIDEELYESFLAVPIMRGKLRIGVIAVQRGNQDYFNEQDVLALRATASQLASMLENIKMLISMRSTVSDKDDRPGPAEFDFKKYAFVKGKSASEGIAHSASIIFDSRPHATFDYGSAADRYSADDFEHALSSTEKELEELQARVEERLSDAASLIFASHLLMLKDSGFVGGMRQAIASGTNPPDAVHQIFLKYKGIFSESPSPLIREKVQDIEDLARRIIRNMVSAADETMQFKDHIVIAREIFPSELLKVSAEEIAGLVLVSGGVTSHVSILARSLRIPLVFIDEPALLNVPDGTPVLLDADVGNLYIRPSGDIVQKFLEQKKARENSSAVSNDLRGPSVTADGTRISLMLNINLLSDLKGAGIDDIDGVGLYRTEFPFMIRSNFPSEEEQYAIYSRLLNDMQGKPVTFRTLDIGGDKVLSYYEFSKEENPFLGMRSIRFSLRHQDIFKQQIRAILRAGAGRDVKIMFPMISSVDEFLQARGLVEQSIKELKDEGIPGNDDPEIGIMVEIPSAVGMIDELARISDFFSIGTNDLIQYTLAVDRTNEKVSDLYIPYHPAVLRSLKTVADAAIRAGIDVSICGDMANSGRYIQFLLGIGVRTLSVDGMYLARVKREIASIDIETARGFAASALSFYTIKDTAKIFKN